MTVTEREFHPPLHDSKNAPRHRRPTTQSTGQTLTLQSLLGECTAATTVCMLHDQRTVARLASTSRLQHSVHKPTAITRSAQGMGAYYTRAPQQDRRNQCHHALGVTMLRVRVCWPNHKSSSMCPSRRGCDAVDWAWRATGACLRHLRASISPCCADKAGPITTLYAATACMRTRVP